MVCLADTYDVSDREQRCSANPGWLHRYSVEKLTDQSGAVVVDYDYDAYGKQSVVAGAAPAGQSYGYTGRRHDAETVLQYFRARYYSAELGRFVSRDPLGMWMGWVFMLHTSQLMR